MAAGGGARAGRRTGPAAARLAWAALGGSLLLVLVGVGVRELGPRAGAYPFWGEVTVNVVVLGTLGALVAARRPGHPVGWLFAGMGLAGAAQLVAGNYAMAARADPALPAGAVAALAAEELRIAGFGMLLAVMLLFPTGRLPSRRWRPVAWLALVGVVGYLAETALEPGRPELLLGYENPFGITGPLWLLGLVGVMAQLFYAAELAAIGSLVVRFWQARGVERQQLKWFVYTAVVALVVLVLTNIFLYDLMEQGPLGSILWGAAPVALAAAVAVAVLRYRLYEIDRLVNRTLVYGLVTALLAGVYAAGVFLLGGLLDPATGDSALAVAASTLAVAALFQPARRRVQAAVDRRFDRRRYDAARTVAAFSARLRDEIDLDTLSSELLGVVDRTVQPVGMSLWLRPGTGRP